jgi:hypothetical protein
VGCLETSDQVQSQSEDEVNPSNITLPLSTQIMVASRVVILEAGEEAELLGGSLPLVWLGWALGEDCR